MATKAEISGFNPEELYEFLLSKLEDEVSMESLSSIKSNRIGGKTFLELTGDDVKEIISLLGERKTVQRLIASYNIPPQQQTLMVS